MTPPARADARVRRQHDRRPTAVVVQRNVVVAVAASARRQPLAGARHSRPAADHRGSTPAATGRRGPVRAPPPARRQPCPTPAPVRARPGPPARTRSGPGHRQEPRRSDPRVSRRTTATRTRAVRRTREPTPRRSIQRGSTPASPSTRTRSPSVIAAQAPARRRSRGSLARAPARPRGRGRRPSRRPGRRRRNQRQLRRQQRRGDDDLAPRRATMRPGSAVGRRTARPIARPADARRPRITPPLAERAPPSPLAPSSGGACSARACSARAAATCACSSSRVPGGSPAAHARTRSNGSQKTSPAPAEPAAADQALALVEQRRAHRGLHARIQPVVVFAGGARARARPPATSRTSPGRPAPGASRSRRSGLPRRSARRLDRRLLGPRGRQRQQPRRVLAVGRRGHVPDRRLVAEAREVRVHHRGARLIGCSAAQVGGARVPFLGHRFDARVQIRQRSHVAAESRAQKIFERARRAPRRRLDQTVDAVVKLDEDRDRFLQGGRLGVCPFPLLEPRDSRRQLVGHGARVDRPRRRGTIGRVEEVAARDPLADADAAARVHQRDQARLGRRQRQRVMGRVPAPGARPQRCGRRGGRCSRQRGYVRPQLQQNQLLVPGKPTRSRRRGPRVPPDRARRARFRLERITDRAAAGLDDRGLAASRVQRCAARRPADVAMDEHRRLAARRPGALRA